MVYFGLHELEQHWAGCPKIRRFRHKINLTVELTTSAMFRNSQEPLTHWEEKNTAGENYAKVFFFFFVKYSNCKRKLECPVSQRPQMHSQAPPIPEVREAEKIRFNHSKYFVAFTDVRCAVNVKRIYCLPKHSHEWFAVAFVDWPHVTSRNFCNLFLVFVLLNKYHSCFRKGRPVFNE